MFVKMVNKCALVLLTNGFKLEILLLNCTGLGGITLKYAKTPPKSVAKSMKAGNPLALLKSAFGRLILSLFAAPRLLPIKV